MSNINITPFCSKGYENVNLEVKGTQEFLGKQIPVIYGGFGSDKKVVTDKTIGEIHNQLPREIRRRINDNIKRFKFGIDVIDLKRVDDSHTLLERIGYAKQSVTQAENIYLLSERGYAKLIKIMDSDLAWEIHDQLMDEYFSMREEKEQQQRMSMEDIIIYQMEQSKLMKQQIDEAKTHALEAKADIVEAKAEIQNIRNVVAINTTDWRKDTTNIINRIAMSRDGGADNIHTIRKESYDLLEKRANCKLSVRRKNLQRVMLENGVSKSKADKVSYLDVIERDNRLKEIYVAIVKEMAIKYSVA